MLSHYILHIHILVQYCHDYYSGHTASGNIPVPLIRLVVVLVVGASVLSAAWGATFPGKWWPGGLGGNSGESYTDPLDPLTADTRKSLVAQQEQV